MTIADTMRAYYAAYNAEDEDRLGSLLDDEVTLISAAGVQTGKAAYLATYRFMIATFVDRMTPERIIPEDGAATVHITDALTARAPVADFLGASLAEGETMTLRLVGRYTITDGKIVRIEISPAPGQAA